MITIHRLNQHRLGMLMQISKTLHWFTSLFQWSRFADLPGAFPDRLCPSGLGADGLTPSQ